jgi:hypothetical protein
MNEKLSEINKQLETLTALINEYQESLLQERVIITKDDFNKIEYLGRAQSNSIYQVFNYSDGMLFELPNDNSKSYKNNHYIKLMAGELDRLILNRMPSMLKSGSFLLNYELESEERTKLKDLYVERKNN